VDWHVTDGGGIPPAVVEAAERGVPIVAHVAQDAPLDAWAAELLEECATVVRYAKPPRSSAASMASRS
jgi:hypothetical protein